MNTLGILIPIALGAGLVALIAFLWSVKSGQFEDLEGAAHRILIDDEPFADAEEQDTETQPAEKRTKTRDRP